jgi:uncharacterized membrane protein YkvA (DUF1232 family)
MNFFALLEEWARRIKRDAITVYFAARDPRTPVPAKIIAVAVAAYALSPIDLIPDFIPVLGYVDDLLLLPVGIWMVVRILPAEVLVQSRAKAELAAFSPRSRVAAIVIVGLWATCAAGLGYWLLQAYGA